MLDLTKIKNAVPAKSYDYFSDAAARLSKIFPALSETEARVLIRLLQIETVTFTDGLVLNSEEPDCSFGFVEASVLISAIAHPDQTWEAWRVSSSSIELKQDEFTEIYDRLVAELESCSNIKSVA